MIDRLVQEHGAWLSGFLRGLTRSEADAEDAFQEVWVRVMRGLRDLRDARGVRGYLATVARSVVIDRYRRDKRYELTIDGTDETGASLAPTLVDSDETPAERHERVSTREEVIAAVRGLPEKQRTVVLMRIEGELTFQEIADAMNAPLGSVLTWMRTATETLKKRLKGGK